MSSTTNKDFEEAEMANKTPEQKEALENLLSAVAEAIQSGAITTLPIAMAVACHSKSKGTVLELSIIITEGTDEVQRLTGFDTSDLFSVKKSVAN